MPSSGVMPRCECDARWCDAQVCDAHASLATVRPRATRRTPGAAPLDEDTAVLHGTYSRLPVRRGTRDARGLHMRARALQVLFKYTLDF